MPTPADPRDDGGGAPPAPGFAQALRFWAWLGCVSFGGPAGQIALMHSELVERRRWISEGRFLHALNYCMLLPGPEAQQLATYLGWLMHRSWGGIAAGALFVLPSLALLIGLSWIYVRFGELPLVAGIFYGLKPAVTAIVLQAALRIGTRVLHHGALWALAAASFGAIAVLGLPFPLIVAIAALAGALGARWRPQVFAAGRLQAHHGADPSAAASPRRALIDDDGPTPPHARFSRRRLAQVMGVGVALWCAAMGLLVAWHGTQGVLAQMGWFFSKAALVTFGGAYAVLPYVVQGAVDQHHWLTGPQMMDGLALGETTPGPLIMVVAFVGFVGGWGQPMFGAGAPALAGIVAAAVVTFFTFLPSFVFILAGAPLIESTHGMLAFTAPLTAITAAVVGVIAHLALFFAAHVWWPQGMDGGFDLAAALLTAAAALALLRWRVGVVPLLVACGAAGLALRLWS